LRPGTRPSPIPRGPTSGIASLWPGARSHGYTGIIRPGTGPGSRAGPGGRRLMCGEGPGPAEETTFFQALDEQRACHPGSGSTLTVVSHSKNHSSRRTIRKGGSTTEIRVVRGRKSRAREIEPTGTR
jgi:hypothetical protein